MHGDAVPGEGQRQLAAAEAFEEVVDDRVEGGVEQRGMQREAARFVGLGRVERDLGVDLVAAPPGRARALEGRAVAEAGEREAVVEVLDGQIGSAPGGGQATGLGGGVRRREHAVGVALPLALARREYMLTARRPSSRGSPTLTWRCAVPLSRRISGASSVSSSTAGAPATSPAASASSSSAVPGQQHGAADGVVGQPGCVASDSSPVSSQPSVPATGKASPSSGWPGPGWRRAVAGFADQPVALALEGVRRGADAPGAR